MYYCFIQAPPIQEQRKQSSIGSPLERKPSLNSGPTIFPRRTSSDSDKDSQQSPHGPPKPEVQRQSSSPNTGNGVFRQGSQGSLFEQIASQAKDLVRETTRQSSQDGILAQMDKVLKVQKLKLVYRQCRF